MAVREIVTGQAKDRAWRPVLERARKRPGELSRQDIYVLLVAAEGGELFRAADEVRRRYVGEQVHLRGIIEFSNYCRRNCHYCGLRAGNQKLPRYRLHTGHILAIAGRAGQLGLGTVVLQSGEDLAFAAGTVAELIYAIKRETGLVVTLSLGDRPREDYACWREA
ncbi:MAG TPA: hypothetical protein GX513_13745, partial [Firmicutes bacterium]|nr:hypothetical protein [Bacillota bacterium]